MTTISDGSENNFLMMANDTTHSACLLQQPDYVPQYYVDNTAYDVDMEARYTVDGVTMKMESQYEVIHYHVNMATFIQLGKWFDYLRENGVYDNTRIILVSDHARGLGQFDITCEGQDMEFSDISTSRISSVPQIIRAILSTAASGTDWTAIRTIPRAGNTSARSFLNGLTPPSENLKKRIGV